MKRLSILIVLCLCLSLPTHSFSADEIKITPSRLKADLKQAHLIWVFPVMAISCRSVTLSKRRALR